MGRDYPKLRGLLARAAASTSSTIKASSTTSSTTTTSVAVPDTRYVPVATNGLRPLVNCP